MHMKKSIQFLIVQRVLATALLAGACMDSRAQTGGLPGVENLAGAWVAAGTISGSSSAELRADVNPRGLATAVFFEYGLPGGGTNTSRLDLPALLSPTNLLASVEGLAPGGRYLWRVVATNLAGRVASPDQVLAIPAVPFLGGISGQCFTNDPLTGALLANLGATVHPNGSATRVTFQYGSTTNYLGGAGFDLGAGQAASNLVYTLSGLVPNYEYHWRVVASNEWGAVASPDFRLVSRIIKPGEEVGGGGLTQLAGDLNGDGVVSRAEVELVMRNFFSRGIELPVTNFFVLGDAQVVGTAPGVPVPSFKVLVSTNLVDWEPLGEAQPRYEFYDFGMDATQRYYRLHCP